MLFLVRDISPWKRAEEAAHEAEKRYRSIFENAVEGIFQSTPDGRFVSANPAMAHIYGYETPEEMMGSITDIENQIYVEPGRRADFMGLMGAQGAVYAFEYQAYRKDGTTIWVSENVRSVLDDSGALLYYEGTVEDVTEHKRAEEAVRESEERLRRAQQAGRLGIWDWDVHANRLVWDGVEPIHGLEPGAFGDSLDDYIRDIHPEDRDTVMETITHAAREGSELNVEYRIIWPDGSVHWVLGKGRAFPDENGRTVRMAGTCQDITDRKRAEEVFRTLTESSPIGMFLLEDGKVTFINPRFREDTGYTLEDLAGRESATLVHPDDREMATEAGREMLRGERSSPIEYRGIKKDGQVGWVLLNLGSVDLEGRRVVVGTYMDISEVKKAEGELFQQERELAVLGERNRMAREIHDTLAQGFTGIVLQLEAAEQALEDSPAEVVDHLSRAKGLARDSLQEARRSVWNLLPQALEQRSLETALREEVGRFAATGQERASFGLSGDRRELSPNVQAALLRICQESLTNVMKHSKATEVNVNLSFYPEAVYLAIQDDGVGFDPTDHTKEKGQGGFGLMSMEQRIKLLGGTFNVSSAMGEGAMVEVRIPTT